MIDHARIAARFLDDAADARAGKAVGDEFARWQRAISARGFRRGLAAGRRRGTDSGARKPDGVSAARSVMPAPFRSREQRVLAASSSNARSLPARAKDRQPDRTALPSAERQRDLGRPAMTGDRGQGQRAVIEVTDGVAGHVLPATADMALSGRTMAVPGGTSAFRNRARIAVADRAQCGDRWPASRSRRWRSARRCRRQAACGSR